jgi:predicted DCC family thiol-disulfide oxidoreductase YuxK
VLELRTARPWLARAAGDLNTPRLFGRSPLSCERLSSLAVLENDRGDRRLTSETSSVTAPNPYEVEVFYDGGCPLCVKEITLLRRWDRAGKILFTDIDAPEFRPEAYGKTHNELMAQMHARLPDGTWLCGVEVFRRMYAAVGFGPLVAVSRVPLVSHALDAGYWLFAKNRLRLTGRCQAGVCKVPRTAQENAGPLAAAPREPAKTAAR